MNTPLNPVFSVLPLRDIVVFPGMIVPLFVGRDKSIKALEDVAKHQNRILLVTQKNATQDDPGIADIYQVGTIATILQILRLPDGTVKVLIEGVERASIVDFIDNLEFYQVHAHPMPENSGDKLETEALCRS